MPAGCLRRWAGRLVVAPTCVLQYPTTVQIAVTGANGRIGRQVVAVLAATHEHQVVALTRPGSLPGPQEDQVRVEVADYTDAAALRVALRDADTLVFVSSDGPVAQVIVHHHNVIQAAAENGSHVVALSGLDADLDSPFCYAVSYGYTEQLLRASGCPVSIARASLYTEFFLGLLTRSGFEGKLRVPAADGRVSFVSRDDVARCLAALATAPPTARHHEITGPEAIDVARFAAIAEQELRTPAEYVAITPREYAAELAATGEDPWWTYAYSTMFDSIREQRWNSISDEVASLTGKPATTVQAVLARHRDRNPLTNTKAP
jgi:NAD(P)H dehydrogenase (quinone)